MPEDYLEDNEFERLGPRDTFFQDVWKLGKKMVYGPERLIGGWEDIYGGRDLWWDVDWEMWDDRNPAESTRYLLEKWFDSVTEMLREDHDPDNGYLWDHQFGLRPGEFAHLTWHEYLAVMGDVDEITLKPNDDLINRLAVSGRYGLASECPVADIVVCGTVELHTRTQEGTLISALTIPWKVAVSELAEGDFNDDEFVGIADLNILAQNWQKTNGNS